MARPCTCIPRHGWKLRVLFQPELWWRWQSGLWMAWCPINLGASRTPVFQTIAVEVIQPFTVHTYVTGISYWHSVYWPISFWLKCWNLAQRLSLDWQPSAYHNRVVVDSLHCIMPGSSISIMLTGLLHWLHIERNKIASPELATKSFITARPILPLVTGGFVPHC